MWAKTNSQRFATDRNALNGDSGLHGVLAQILVVKEHGIGGDHVIMQRVVFAWAWTSNRRFVTKVARPVDANYFAP